jgi:hypothetical protein
VNCCERNRVGMVTRSCELLSERLHRRRCLVVDRSLHPGSWEVRFIEATAELLLKGWTEDELQDLVQDVADAESIFQDEAEAS